MGITRRELNSARVPYADGEPRWEVRLRRPDGSQYAQTFRTRREADAWERGELTAQSAGAWVDPGAGRAPLETRVDSYLFDRPQPLAPTTVEHYEDLLRRFILPTFGEVPISQITTEAVRSWVARVGRQVSEMQAAKAYRLLRAMLNVAVSDGVLVRNPCNLRGAGQEHSRERPLASAEEIHQLAAAIEPHLKALVLIAGFGGLRKGELLGLNRSDVDLAAGTLSVTRQVVYLRDGTRLETKPKTAAGVRTVSLPPFLVDRLRVHLDSWTPPGAGSSVFVGVHGRPLGPVALQTAYDRARQATGLTQYTLHDLRHAAGTLAAWTGATTKELMARLGHSTHDAALRYQHAARDRDAEIAAKLDMFRPRTQAPRGG